MAQPDAAEGSESSADEVEGDALPDENAGDDQNSRQEEDQGESEQEGRRPPLIQRVRSLLRRDPSIAISSVALIASITAIALSQSSSSVDREIDQRNRLSDVVQSIVELQGASLQQGATSSNTGIAGPQMALLAEEGDRLLANVTGSAAEYITVGQAYGLAGSLPKSLELAQAARELALRPDEMAAVDRSMAAIYFLFGQYDQGRQIFDTARGQLEQAPGGAAARATRLVDIDTVWLNNELANRQCPQAQNVLQLLEQDLPIAAFVPGTAEQSLQNYRAAYSTICP